MPDISCRIQVFLFSLVLRAKGKGSFHFSLQLWKYFSYSSEKIWERLTSVSIPTFTLGARNDVSFVSILWLGPQDSLWGQEIPFPVTLQGSFQIWAKRCSRQHHLHIFPLKVWCTTPAGCCRSKVSVPDPAGRLVARTPTVPLGDQTLRAQVHCQSYHKGLMGTSPHLRGDTRLRTDTRNLPPFFKVTGTGGRHSPWGGKLLKLLLQNR